MLDANSCWFFLAFTYLQSINIFHTVCSPETDPKTEHRFGQTCMWAELINSAADGPRSLGCARLHTCALRACRIEGSGSGPCAFMTSGNTLPYKSTQQRRGYRAASRSNPPAAGLETPAGSTNYISYAAIRRGVRAFPVPIPAQDPLH